MFLLLTEGFIALTVRSVVAINSPSYFHCTWIISLDNVHCVKVAHKYINARRQNTYTKSGELRLQHDNKLHKNIKNDTACFCSSLFKTWKKKKCNNQPETQFHAVKTYIFVLHCFDLAYELILSCLIKLKKVLLTDS